MEQWLAIALIAVNSVAALGMMWASICAVNHMRRGTNFLIRLAYILIGTGSFAALLGPAYYGRPPTWPELFLLTGLVLLTYAERRRRNRIFKRVASD